MCVNQRFIRNPHTGRTILAKCGHCEACKQEKANNRASRIRNNLRKGEINLFCSLTYANAYIPYIRYTDLVNMQYVGCVPIYRDHDVRCVRCGSSYETAYASSLNKVPYVVGYYDLPEEYNPNDYLPYQLHAKPDCIGVCLFSDLQKFFKRLRINLKRKYNYELPFRYFACTEYGETTFRSHIHSLITIPSKDAEVYISAINESWPFDFSLPRKVEVARDASGYVASYVNRDTDLPKILREGDFRQKHSYSQNYGVGIPIFSLPSLLEKVRKGSLEYNVLKTDKNGNDAVVTLSVPKYVISRYFPRFKGYCRLANNQAIERIADPALFRTKAYELELNCGDVERIIISLQNSYENYRRITRFDRLQYAKDFVRAWQVFENTKLRQFYENKDNIPQYEMYDNIADLVVHPRLSPSLWNIIPPNFFEFNPNKFSFRVEKTNNLTALYRKKIKTKKTLNIVHNNLGYNL